MTPFLWFTVIWWTINAIAAVWLVGKEREPITPGAAAFSVLLYGGLIFWALQQAT